MVDLWAERVLKDFDNSGFPPQESMWEETAMKVHWQDRVSYCVRNRCCKDSLSPVMVEPMSNW